MQALDLTVFLYIISIWAIPVLFAITLLYHKRREAGVILLGMTALTGTYPMAAQFGRAGVGHLFIPAGYALCIVTTGAAASQGYVAYTQQ